MAKLMPHAVPKDAQEGGEGATLLRGVRVQRRGAAVRIQMRHGSWQRTRRRPHRSARRYTSGRC